MAAAHPDQRFLYCYRAHRLKDSLLERLPSNAGRAWLRSGGITPWTCRIFHSLNQRIDSRFPRSVATFHDLFVLTGEYSTREFRERFAAQAREAAGRADLIIAVSQFTKRQVTGLLGVEDSRVRVIHHGVRPIQGSAAPEAERSDLVLHVGAIQRRKNSLRLVEAFEAMPAGWRLVLAGSAGFGATEIFERIARSPRRADIETPGFVSDAELERLYRQARIFAFPSLDEGFGMPVLDAMLRGVPVLSSRASALEEVAGDAALLVDPGETAAIAEGLKGLANDVSLREAYRAKGFKRAEEFKWSQAVDATWAVYRELL